MKKKILAVILAVMMLVCALPFAAFASNDGYVHSEVLDNDNYYHMQYVEGEGYFKNQFALYTALGFYDKAWYNYFDNSVDIDYAKAILLGLIEQVEAEYKNETFEEVMKLLGGAKGALDVIDKVGDFASKFTDALEFTQSAEWGTTLGILNTAIKAANYGNEVYKAYIKGYATILSAKAASAFYGDFLTYLVENCKNEDVQVAAAEIAETIDAEMQAAVDELVKSLVENAGKDAASLAANIALDAYGVTAAIKTGYNAVRSISNKLFNTSNKYEFMMSLVETYYIEDCFGDWAKAAFASEDGEYASFAESTVIAIRATGEKLLANLANAKKDALVSMISKYDATEIKVRTAFELAKLEAASAIFASGDDNGYTGSAAFTGNTNVTVPGTDILVADGEAVSAVTASGAYASVLNDGLGGYVKAVYFKGTADRDVVLAGAESVGTAYIVAGGLYSCVDTTTGRTITLKNALTAPSIVVADEGKDEIALDMSESFVKTCDPSVAVSKSSKPSGGSSSSSGSSTGSISFSNFFSSFFQSIIDAFKNIFKIFKK